MENTMNRTFTEMFTDLVITKDLCPAEDKLAEIVKFFKSEGFTGGVRAEPLPAGIVLRFTGAEDVPVNAVLCLGIEDKETGEIDIAGFEPADKISDDSEE